MSTRIVSFLLVFILLFSSVTSVYGMDNGFIDMPDENHWSYNALKSAIDNGLLKGYNNKITPEGKPTRAQIAAVINSAFGAIDTADISRFTDVSEKAWYYKDMSMAFRMGTFVGTGNKLLPLKNATRQEVFCVIAHALKLSSTNIEALDRFSDKDDTATWAQESLAALAENNYISGFNGKLNPNSEITRAELVQIMHNIIKSYITSAGTYTFSAEGNVMVNCPNVVIKDCIIKGDLILGDGVGNGDITLDNTKIEGRLLARGGGQNTILIKNNSAVGNVIISKTGSGAIRIKTEGNVQIEHVYVDDGKDDVILEGIFNQIIVETDTPVVVKDATVSSVNVKAAGAYISIEGKTTISSVNFNKTAQDSFIFIADGATVRNMLINAQNVKVIGWKNTNSSNPQSPAKAPLSVTSISAINANQIQVVFNKELNEASAKDISFYEIKDKGTKIITLTAGAVTLTNPKTAVITLSDSNRLTYNTTAKVTVKRGIKALDGTELASDITSNVKVEELIAPTCISCEVTGEKTLKLSFSKPVCDGTNNSFLNIENFRVNYLKPAYVEDLTSAGIKLFETYTYTVQSAELLGDTIILTLTEALSEGNLKVHINNSITENPIQDYAGNILSNCEITFNYVKTGDTSSQVTVKKADQDMVTLSFSKPVTATDLKLFHTNESMASNMSTPVSINKGTFVAEITFEFPDKIPVGTTDLFLVNSSDPSCKAFNIYGEYVPDQTLVADVTPEKNPPYVTKSELINNNTFKIFFNEQVSKSFAENLANYDFKTFDNYTTVSFLPTLSNDSKSVELYLPQGLRDNTKYNVVVRNAEDISGNKTASDIQLEFTNGEHSSPSVEVNKCRTNNNEGKIIIYFSEPMNEAQMLDKASYKVATTPDAIYASLGTGDKISKLSDRSVLIEMSKTVNSPSVMLAPIMDLSGTRLYNSIAPVYIKDIKEEILSVESANLIAKNKVKVTFSRILQSFNADDISFTGVTSGEISVQNIESMINNDKDKTEVVLVLNKELSTDVKYNGSVVSAVTKEDCNSMSALGCKLSPSQTISINDMVAPELIKYDHDSNPLTEPVEKVVLSGNILTSMVDGKVAKNTTGTITLSFSEPILEFSLSVLTFAVEGYTVTSISNAVNKNEVVLSIKANANNTPAITTVRQNNNISDYSGNILLLDKVLQVR